MAAAVSFAVISVGSHRGLVYARSRLDRAIVAGDWRAVDRLKRLPISPDADSVRHAAAIAIRAGDCQKLQKVLRLAPGLNLDAFVRQQAGTQETYLLPELGTDSDPPASRSPELLEVLLSSGANPNCVLQASQGDPTRTALGRLLALRGAETDPTMIQKYDLMEQVFRKHGGSLNLFDAARFVDVDRLKVLLAKGANPNDRDQLDRPVIYLAALSNSSSVVDTLIRYGADVNAVTGISRGYDRESALTACEAHAYIDIAEQLIQAGATISGFSTSARKTIAPAWIYAAAGGNTSHVRFLLNHGASMNAVGSIGETAIMNAANPVMTSTQTQRRDRAAVERPVFNEHGRAAVIAMLTALGADVNKRDDVGRTALMYAYRSPVMTRLLLNSHANVDIRDAWGRTALDYAVRRHNLPVAKLLIEHSANVNNQDRSGYTALGIAMLTAPNGGKDQSLVEYLKSKGAHLGLHEAAGFGDAAEFRLALKDGADLTAHVLDREPLLNRAAHGGSAEIVRLLLDRGAAVNAADAKGWTPLMVAAGDGREAVVRLLLERGASPGMRTQAGTTAYQLAVRRRHTQIQVLLEQAEKQKG